MEYLVQAKASGKRHLRDGFDLLREKIEKEQRIEMLRQQGRDLILEEANQHEETES